MTCFTKSPHGVNDTDSYQGASREFVLLPTCGYNMTEQTPAQPLGPEHFNRLTQRLQESSHVIISKLNKMSYMVEDAACMRQRSDPPRQSPIMLKLESSAIDHFRSREN